MLLHETVHRLEVSIRRIQLRVMRIVEDTFVVQIALSITFNNPCSDLGTVCMWCLRKFHVRMTNDEPLGTHSLVFRTLSTSFSLENALALWIQAEFSDDDFPDDFL